MAWQPFRFVTTKLQCPVRTLTLLALSLLLFTCEKEQAADDCQVENLAQLTIRNTTDTMVEAWLNDEFVAGISAQEESTIEAPAGIHRLYVEEAEGTSTRFWEINVQLFRCQERRLSLEK